jgi:two-component system chemotaxis response regulator CheY
MPDAKKTVTVLIVDDSEVARELLRDLVEACGFSVVGEAADGVQAVREYLKLTPTVTFMDIKMPIMGGIEASREILASDPQARIVVCSASDAEELASAAASAGARGFLAKPYLQDQVEAAVKGVL